MKGIEDFPNEAMDTLRRQPQTVAEIGDANQKHNEYNEKTPVSSLKFVLDIQV